MAPLASRRVHPYTEPMDAFVFQSQKDRRCFGFSTNEAGVNLPREFAPWQRADAVTLPLNVDYVAISGSPAVLAALREDGYYVANAGDEEIIRPIFGRR